jgi:hypothetical protein
MKTRVQAEQEWLQGLGGNYGPDDTMEGVEPDIDEAFRAGWDACRREIEEAIGGRFTEMDDVDNAIY